jgi:hypothetical protein
LDEKKFDRIFLEAVDEALASLGESARQSIYFHLDRKFNVPREDIPRRYEDFARGLEKIFGVGSRFIEILIMKKLHDKTGQSLEWNDTKEFVFVEYVTAAKRSFSKENRLKTCDS